MPNDFERERVKQERREARRELRTAREQLERLKRSRTGMQKEKLRRSHTEAASARFVRADNTSLSATRGMTHDRQQAAEAKAGVAKLGDMIQAQEEKVAQLTEKFDRLTDQLREMIQATE